MLGARSLVAGMIAVALVYLAVSVIVAVRPSNGGAYGGDSYGTRALGYGALFETLKELRLPVERTLLPPVSFTPDATLAFLAPSLGRMRSETIYVENVAGWVRAGGRVFVAPPPWVRPIEEKKGGDPMLAAMSLSRLERVHVNPSEAKIEGLRVSTAEGPRKPGLVTGWLRRLGWERTPRPSAVLPVEADGDLVSLGAVVREITVPADGLWVLDLEGKPVPEAAGRIYFSADSGRKTIGAVYALGDGQVILLSDPRLVANAFLYQSDNAVLAVHLLAPTGGAVVFDEFYHGPAGRGNPFILLAYYPYGLLLLFVVLTASLWAWRAAVSLGPPVPQPHPARSLMEYVEAMARMFQGARDAERFLLAELRSGVLWMLARRVGSRRPETLEFLELIERRDPERARRLRSALADVDRVLAGDSPARAVAVSRELVRCL